MIFNINHKDTREYVYPLSRNEIYVKLQLFSDEYSKISIVYWNYFEPKKIEEKEFESFEISNKSSNYYTRIESKDVIKYCRYYIKIKQENDIFYYSHQGITRDVPTQVFVFPDVNELDIFMAPKWSEGAIGYQIFVDRFFKETTNNKVKTSDWDDEPTRENHFGGTLSGIAQKMSYVSSIGAKIIYLTPIFKSESNHKYDITDYYNIDPDFGTKEDLKYLIKIAHKHKIKVILDGVFNHIGYYSEQFQDVIKEGNKSRYFDWFYINGDNIDVENVNYECVGYYKWMPKLRYKSQTLRKYILDIGQYWIKECNIDGWRLDVADEVDYTFWTEFRCAIKLVKEDALLIGETWKNGYDLLRGDQLDSVMNYRFRDAVIEYIVDEKIKTESFRNRIETIYSDYPKQTHNVLYNLLGSHDTERIISRCNKDLSKLRLILAIQFLLPGIPFIYYGDEIGLEGLNDPLCRKTMDWNQIDNKVSKIYQEIVNLRKDNIAIRLGDLKHIQFENQVYGFIRIYKNQHVIVLMNPTKEKIKAKIDLSINRQKIVLDYEIDSFDFVLAEYNVGK